MTTAHIQALASASTETLAKWWAQLNDPFGAWPEELGPPETIEQYWNPEARRSQIMAAIMDRVGLKECLRAWNSTKLPGPAFDEWWESLNLREIAAHALQAANIGVAE